MSEVAADWHEPMIPQRIMRPSIDNEARDVARLLPGDRWRWASNPRPFAYESDTLPLDPCTNCC